MLLLDTHAFVWLASDQTQLTPAGKAAIRAAAGALCVSSITGLEIAILVKRGRLSLPLPPGVFIERALRQHAIEEVPLDLVIAMRSAALPDIHNDPFDRLVLATALTRGCPVLSKDTILPQYPNVTVLW
jgi:PIN domain nuclease of toxin-antitoxin system